MACEFSDIAITPECLEFEAKEGSRFVPPGQSLYFTKTGEGTLTPNWRAEITEDWLKMNPGSDNAPTMARVSVKSVGMKTGEYKARILVTSQNDITITPSFIVVNLRVRGETEPDPIPVPVPEPPTPEPIPDPIPEPTPEPTPIPEPMTDNWVLKILKLIWDLIFNWKK